MREESVNLTRATELQSEIVSHVNAIRKCEEEIMKIRRDVINDYNPGVSETLWIDLRRVQNGQMSYSRSRGKFDEDSCCAIASLLEEQLRPRQLSGLIMLGCTIQTEDNHGRFYISGDVSSKFSSQIRV